VCFGCGKYGRKVGICHDNKLFDMNKETNKIPNYDLVRVFSPKEMESATRDASLCTVQVPKVQQSVNLISTMKISLVHEKTSQTNQEDIPSYFLCRDVGQKT
jgi:hypothetical protein